jgi:hypothetical protein
MFALVLIMVGFILLRDTWGDEHFFISVIIAAPFIILGIAGITAGCD